MFKYKALPFYHFIKQKGRLQLGLWHFIDAVATGSEIIELHLLRSIPEVH